MGEVFCGIDWGEQVHHVALIDAAGKRVAAARIEDSLLGHATLLGMLAGAGDTKRRPIAVAVETPHGLLVSALVQAGRPVYAINPLAAARYRERHSVVGRKSDSGDAIMLANILRTDRHLHQPIAADSDLVRAIMVLARAHQDAVTRRTAICQHLRVLLRDYYPGFLQLFAAKMDGLYKPESRAMLELAPTPTLAARLTRARIATLLQRAGRRRGIDDRANDILVGLAQPQLHQPDLVEEAMADQAIALLEVLDAECANIDILAAALDKQFLRHPDHGIICSFAGLGPITGARILAEIGDDPRRFTSARGLKAYAGSAPITKASGRMQLVTRRYIKNNRLNAAGMLWASAAILHPGPERSHYLARRTSGDQHIAALRHLFNRMLGQLHHCLHHREMFDESRGYPETVPNGE